MATRTEDASPETGSTLADLPRPLPPASVHIDRLNLAAKVEELTAQLRASVASRRELEARLQECEDEKTSVDMELEVELEAQKAVNVELLQKYEAEQKRWVEREKRLEAEVQNLRARLEIAGFELEQCRAELVKKEQGWVDGQQALVTAEKLEKQATDLKSRLKDARLLIKDYGARVLIVEKAVDRAVESGGGRKIGETGLMPLLLEAMRQLPDDALLQREVSTLITHVAFTPRDYIYIGGLNGAELALEALRRHATSRMLVSSALRLVWKMATACPHLRNRLRHLKAIGVVLHALAVNGLQAIKRLEYHACKIIAHLLPDDVASAAKGLDGKDPGRRRKRGGSLSSTGGIAALITGADKGRSVSGKRKKVSRAPSRSKRRLSEPVIRRSRGLASEIVDLPDIACPTVALSQTCRNLSTPSPHESKPGTGDSEKPLPGAQGEIGDSLTLEPKEVARVLVTCLRWASKREVEFDTSKSRGSAADKMWKENTAMAIDITRHCLNALVSGVGTQAEGYDAVRAYLGRPGPQSALVAAWQTFPDNKDVVHAASVVIHGSLDKDRTRREKQCEGLSQLGLAKLLDVSRARCSNELQVTQDLTTLSRTFFVDTYNEYRSRA